MSKYALEFTDEEIELYLDYALKLSKADKVIQPLQPLILHNLQTHPNDWITLPEAEGKEYYDAYWPLKDTATEAWKLYHERTRDMNPTRRKALEYYVDNVLIPK